MNQAHIQFTNSIISMADYSNSTWRTASIGKGSWNECSTKGLLFIIQYQSLRDKPKCPTLTRKSLRDTVFRKLRISIFGQLSFALMLCKNDTALRYKKAIEFSADLTVCLVWSLSNCPGSEHVAS